MPSHSGSIIPAERIHKCIFFIRGHNVIQDSDLAGFYGVETGALVRAVKRNIDRFPADFMFQLNKDEYEAFLRCQIGISKKGRGGRRYAPYVFTEHGVAMLSSVLRSKRAVEINIAIMRTFVRLREILANNAALRRKIERHDDQIKYIFNILGQMRRLPEPKKSGRPFGFHGKKDQEKSNTGKAKK
jgi:phage regulator Rha-like protein